MSLDNFETVSFRVRKSDFVEFQRVAKMLYNTRNPTNNLSTIKEPKVSVMAKTFLYVMTNQFKKIEEEAKVVVAQAQAQGQMPQMSPLGGPQ